LPGIRVIVDDARRTHVAVDPKGRLDHLACERALIRKELNRQIKDTGRQRPVGHFVGDPSNHLLGPPRPTAQEGFWRSFRASIEVDKLAASLYRLGGEGAVPPQGEAVLHVINGGRFVKGDNSEGRLRLIALPASSGLHLQLLLQLANFCF
jgi:hypothetical protein